MFARARSLAAGAARRRLDGAGGSTLTAQQKLGGAALLSRRSLPQLFGSGRSGSGEGAAAACYTTERIVELRSGGRKDLKTLYDAAGEKENCGVGLIASLKSIPSRDVVEKADEMLVRMAHRGGCGCDPASGDGSGMFRCWCPFCFSVQMLVTNVPSMVLILRGAIAAIL
jgi:Glutamine amidotransferases class-II